jgi:hypothetical protein
MYFTDGLGTHINKCPLTGCSTPTAVYTGIGYAAELLYDVPNATLYVQDPNNNKLYSVSTGGALNWSIGIGANSWGIATDGTNVYWGQLGGIQKVARSNGGNQSTFAPVSASGIVEGVWYDPTSNDIYGFADVTPGALLQCTLAGSCTTVAPSTFNYATIGVVQGSTIYFSAAGTSPNYTDGGLYSAPVSNPTSVTAMATGANYARALGMAADSSGVYFASFQSGNVYKCGLSGCGSGPTEIGPNQGEVTAMATDSQYVYWITQGSIMRWTK